MAYVFDKPVWGGNLLKTKNWNIFPPQAVNYEWSLSMHCWHLKHWISGGIKCYTDTVACKNCHDQMTRSVMNEWIWINSWLETYCMYIYIYNKMVSRYFTLKSSSLPHTLLRSVATIKKDTERRTHSGYSHNGAGHWPTCVLFTNKSTWSLFMLTNLNIYS